MNAIDKIRQQEEKIRKQAEALKAMKESLLFHSKYNGKLLGRAVLADAGICFQFENDVALRIESIQDVLDFITKLQEGK